MEETTKIKKSVRIRLKKEAEQAHREENAGKLGAVSATLKNIPTSPRKMRLVADLIRGERVDKALFILQFEAKVGARYLEKLLRSAIANWESQNEDLELDDAELYVKEIRVDSGRMLKRLRPAPQGRGHRIRKRSNHVSLVLDSLNTNTFEETASEEEVVETDNE